MRPPWVKISQRSASPGLRHLLGVDGDDDALIAEFFRRFFDESAAALTAAVLIETLSAPEASSARMSSMVRTPPPTVSGMKHASAVRCTTSSMMSRFSWLAVMSRKHELVGAGVIIGDRRFHRIAGIAQD